MLVRTGTLVLIGHDPIRQILPEDIETTRFPASRDVAQLGSAPEWGSGGRRFESGRPDSEEVVAPLGLR